MIQFERALADEKLPDAAKVYAGFQLLFEKIPPDFDDAVQKLFWFYCGGADETEAEKRKREAICLLYTSAADDAAMRAAMGLPAEKK